MHITCHIPSLAGSSQDNHLPCSCYCAVPACASMCQQSVALTTAWSRCLVCVRACLNTQKLQVKSGLDTCFRPPDAACLHLYNACNDRAHVLTHCGLQVGQKHSWQGLTPLQAAHVCWGLATARHCTPALGHILDGRMAECLCELNPRQMTALLWGCAILLHQPHAALHRLSKYFKADDVTGQTGMHLVLAGNV